MTFCIAAAARPLRRVGHGHEPHRCGCDRRFADDRIDIGGSVTMSGITPMPTGTAGQIRFCMTIRRAQVAFTRWTGSTVEWMSEISPPPESP